MASVEDMLATNESWSISREQEIFERMSDYTSLYVNPAIGACGVVGNVANIVVLSRGLCRHRRQRHFAARSDVATTASLVALAVANLAFCIAVLPAYFFDAAGGYTAIVYVTYRAACLNALLFLCTWTTVLVSVGRYVTVCHPFAARNAVTLARVLAAYAIIAVASVAVTIPQFLRSRIRTAPGVYYIEPVTAVASGTFAAAYKATWAILGSFAPLVILIYCNFNLVLDVKRSGYPGRRGATRAGVTVVFVVIVTSHLLLVCPATVLNVIAGAYDDCSAETFYVFLSVVVVCNSLIVVNFAGNFLLYCAYSVPFKKRLTRMLYSCCSQVTQCA